MCGIAGIVSFNPQDVTIERLKNMTDVISHRGPDGEGHWISANSNIGLGHRRLSIIDLSNEANQPMHYLNRYSIVFNGEIYNYIEIKETLIKYGYQFRTQSDTEVLMALYDKEGSSCLQQIDGMFAFVLYDAQEQKVFCARDRFGEKPFFYNYEPGKHFIFGSELKVLWAAGVDKRVNQSMLYNYLLTSAVENSNDLSQTFYENCKRLPHSHYIEISLNDFSFSIHKYFDISWEQQDFSITEKQATEQFRELFFTSVSRRLRSDVPVGSSLSGGLDSSLVVSAIDNLIQGSSQIQRTFSAVFPGFQKDESKYMRLVIDKTSVDPYFVTPTDEGMAKDLEQLSIHQEEPFISASIYVQYCVMKLAKEHNVTVLLDGQGADEIMAGYHGYFPIYFAALQKKGNASYKEAFESYQKLHKGNEINILLESNLKQELLNKLRGSFPNTLQTLKSVYKTLRPPENERILNRDFINGNYTYKPLKFPKSLNEALYNSTIKTGLQELLRYADRNSMAHSREVRLPFLNHTLVEFLFSLPDEYKIKSGWTKWVMRQSFERELPPQIAWRKDKIGYEPPQKSWMENKIVIEKIKESQQKLIQEGIINKSVLDKKMENIDNLYWSQLMAAQLFY